MSLISERLLLSVCVGLCVFSPDWERSSISMNAVNRCLDFVNLSGSELRINRWIICTVQVADGGEDVKLDMANESLKVVKKCQ